MMIYCDQLSLAVCIKAIKLRFIHSIEKKQSIIQVLDSLSDSYWRLFLRICMQFAGFHIKEAEFFAGHLKNSIGESVCLAVERISNDLAVKTAERVIKHSQFLGRLNNKWGRNTVLKYIAKMLKVPATQVGKKVMVADILQQPSHEKQTVLIIQRLSIFDPDLVRAIAPEIQIYFYHSWTLESFKWRRFSALPLLIFIKAREIKWLIGPKIKKQGTDPLLSLSDSKESSPSLLVLQEGDLSLDRSYRTQPHWLFPEDGNLPFQTIVLQTGSVGRLPIDYKRMKEQDIVFLSKKNQYLLPRRYRSLTAVRKLIRRTFWECIKTSFLGSSVDARYQFWMIWLLYHADALAALCEHRNIKAFMTCESQVTHADAMQLISPYFNITTLSYQYSNISMVGPIMMTNADMMLTFAPMYHKRWVCNGIRPKRFIDIGYIYDTSFDHVRLRAREQKNRLKEAGATFIISYLDESVQADKYGLTSVEDHCEDILRLLRLVLDDPSIGIIIKTQFQQNLPKHFDDIAAIRDAAISTGRYVELSYGVHRNIIFPAEAALSSEVAISYAVGATAAVEVALTGTRCVLVNPYGMKSENDFLYEQSNIVYRSLKEALIAIDGLRNNIPDQTNLGDWSPIIEAFDPFRDGKSCQRFRKILEQTVMHTD